MPKLHQAHGLCRPCQLTFHWAGSPAWSNACCPQCGRPLQGWRAKTAPPWPVSTQPPVRAQPPLARAQWYEQAAARAREARLPYHPDDLAGALHERVHTDLGEETP